MRKQEKKAHSFKKDIGFMEKMYFSNFRVPSTLLPKDL